MLKFTKIRIDISVPSIGDPIQLFDAQFLSNSIWTKESSLQ